MNTISQIRNRKEINQDNFKKNKIEKTFIKNILNIQIEHNSVDNIATIEMEKKSIMRIAKHTNRKEIS